MTGDRKKWPLIDAYTNPLQKRRDFRASSRLQNDLTRTEARNWTMCQRVRQTRNRGGRRLPSQTRQRLAGLIGTYVGAPPWTTHIVFALRRGPDREKTLYTDYVHHRDAAWCSVSPLRGVTTASAVLPACAEDRMRAIRHLQEKCFLCLQRLSLEGATQQSDLAFAGRTGGRRACAAAQYMAGIHAVLPSPPFPTTVDHYHRCRVAAGRGRGKRTIAGLCTYRQALVLPRLVSHSGSQQICIRTARSVPETTSLQLRSNAARHHTRLLTSSTRDGP